MSSRRFVRALVLRLETTDIQTICSPANFFLVRCSDGSTFMGERLTVQFARGARATREGNSNTPQERPPPRPRRTGHRMGITGLPTDTSWQVRITPGYITSCLLLFSPIFTRVIWPLDSDYFVIWRIACGTLSVRHTLYWTRSYGTDCDHPKTSWIVSPTHGLAATCGPA